MENKADIINNLLCTACLCVGRSIREIRDEKLKNYYMDTLKEIPLNNIPVVVPIICWECEALLKKLLSFREQVKDSYRILQTYTENLNECLLSDVSRNPRLKIHKNDTIAIVPDGDVKLEQNEDTKTYNADIMDDVPDAGPEMVLCNVKRHKNKRKSSSKSNKSTDSRIIFESDPVDILEGSSYNVKLETKNDINDGNVDLKLNSTNTEANTDLQTDNDLKKNKKKIQNKAAASKTIRNQSIEIDAFKTEMDAEDNIKDDQISDIDMDDVEAEIEIMLNEVKDEDETDKTVKKDKESKNSSSKMLTVELSYDEMQSERSRLMNRDVFLNAEYKCETCLIIFNCASSLKAHHAKKHAISGDFICSICKTIISSVEAFTAHYKRHMRRYECIVCKKRTTDVKAMYQHLYKKHEVTLKNYKCNICGKVSKSIDSHRYHRDTHKARVACSQCDKTFSHRAGLMNHRLAVHELQNEFPCTLCDKVFRWKTSLKRHLEKHETDTKGTSTTNRAYCESCGVGFSSVCSYQRHLRNSLKHVTHDQLKFICDHCNQRFADKTKLRDHIEEKHLHRTFHCPICNKSSKNRVGLEQHIRAVHKGRPNNRMCHHCGKGFPTKVQLESHIRTHTGERPFMCEYCPTTFSQQSNLYKHHRQVHLNIKTKRYLCKKRKIDSQIVDPQPSFTLPLMQYMPENAFSL